VVLFFRLCFVLCVFLLFAQGQSQSACHLDLSACAFSQTWNKQLSSSWPSGSLYQAFHVCKLMVVGSRHVSGMTVVGTRTCPSLSAPRDPPKLETQGQFLQNKVRLLPTPRWSPSLKLKIGECCGFELWVKAVIYSAMICSSLGALARLPCTMLLNFLCSRTVSPNKSLFFTNYPASCILL
jgi:hypothetical protein